MYVRKSQMVQKGLGCSSRYIEVGEIRANREKNKVQGILTFVQNHEKSFKDVDLNILPALVLGITMIGFSIRTSQAA